MKGLIVPVVFASLPEIFTIQPNRAAYVMRILIVEDETLVALGTQADLETAGHTVVGLAMTSEEAINLADWCRPDLVLMDIRLAEGNGVEAAQAIHTRWAIPSLFATSYVETLGSHVPCRSWLLEEAIRSDGALYKASRSSSR